MGLIVILLVIVVVAIVGFLFWIGVFKKMNIQKAKIDQTDVFYKPYQGAYDKLLGAEFLKIHNSITSHSIGNKAFSRHGSRMFGIYYDNPQEHPNSKELRADIGFLFTTKPLLNSERERFIKEFTDKGYIHARFPETECYHETFPLRSPKFL